MATRIGVDIGGTFTDLIFYDDQTGGVHVAKTATTPGELERGVLNAVESAVPADKVAEVEYFMHGTTIALNALLTRSGASTGLICTAGFRDVIEIRRQMRPKDMLTRRAQIVGEARRNPVRLAQGRGSAVTQDKIVSRSAFRDFCERN